jgi:hypothetical protein
LREGWVAVSGLNSCWI